MSRKKLHASIEAEVLTRSRRRCCICFGLDRSTSIVQGQIAHLDKDSGNDNIENLAFLCLAHHDEYDSRTSQSKGFKVHEVKQYREELLASVGDTFSQIVAFGQLKADPSDPFDGKYVRLDPKADSAEIVLTPLPSD